MIVHRLLTIVLVIELTQKTRRRAVSPLAAGHADSLHNGFSTKTVMFAKWFAASSAMIAAACGQAALRMKTDNQKHHWGIFLTEDAPMARFCKSQDSFPALLQMEVSACRFRANSSRMRFSRLWHVKIKTWRVSLSSRRVSRASAACLSSK